MNGKMTDLALARQRAMRMEPEQPAEQIAFHSEQAVEPTAAARARVAAEIQRCKDAGIVPPENFELAPDERELVVYDIYTVTRNRTPGGLTIPGGQLAQAKIRVGERGRILYSDLKERADAQFERMFGPTPPQHE